MHSCRADDQSARSAARATSRRGARSITLDATHYYVECVTRFADHGVVTLRDLLDRVLRSPRGVHEIDDLNAKRCGYAAKRLDRRIPDTALDLANELVAQAGSLAKLLLRQPALPTKLLHALADLFAKDAHPPKYSEIGRMAKTP